MPTPETRLQDLGLNLPPPPRVPDCLRLPFAFV